MKTIKSTTALSVKILAALLLLAAVSTSAPQSETQVRRFLLSAGANNGGRDKVILRYAVSDANAFANVLMEMGGVDRKNALILANPNRNELLDAINDINRRITISAGGGADIRTEVFVYYSGHADEDGLKLSGETLSWADFRNAVNNLDADVRVAVLDACGSGAITRTKGGVARPAFLSDASMNMKGYAFLTSSNENEASQESDRIRGSYFTHALLSGMRGAADMTGNGRVTINEAYQYAFNETIQNTQNTRAGTQHPSRDMNLAGTGDIVMTDLRRTSATLSLDANIEGRFFIRDESGNLFAELRKIRGRPIELGIPPGKYTVQMEAPSRMWSAGEVVISHGGTTAVTMNDMRPMPPRRRTVARGMVDGDVDYYDDEDEEYYYDDIDDAASADTSASERLSTQADVIDKPESSTPAPTALDTACAAPRRSNVHVVATSDIPESGIQLSFVNIANASYCGTQIGLANILSHDSRGAQIGAVNMSTGTLRGTQIGMLLNISSDPSVNTQIGGYNFADNVNYLQLGSVNFASNVNRSQIGGISIAKNVERNQYGWLNVAGSAGRQIGVFNFAGYGGKTPFGLLSVAGNGIIDVTAYADVSDEMGVYLRTGMPWFYNILEFGIPIMGENGGEKLPRSFGYGFGTRFGMNGKFTVNLDFILSAAYNYESGIADLSEELPYRRAYHHEDDNFLFDVIYKARLGVSYSVRPYIAITGGISLSGNHECDFIDDWQKSKRTGSVYFRETDRGHRFHVWPGIYVGWTIGKIHANYRERGQN